MAKRFSVINMNDGENEIFMRGFADLKDLKKSELIVGLMTEVPSSTLVPFQILHCLFLDYPGNDTDISHEELDKLVELYDDLVEDEYISLEEVLEFELPGLMSEDTYVEY